MGGLGLTGRLFTPSIPEEIGEAAGAYPAERQKQLQEQAQTSAAQFQAASPRIAFLAQMASQNPAIAGNPQYKDTLTKLFSMSGLGAPPMTPDGKIDVTALGGMDAQHKFVSENWTTIMSMAPAKRQTYAQTAAGVTLPANLLDPSIFPQQTITTPTQAADVLNKLNTDLSTFGMGRTGIGAMTTQLDLFEKPLRDMGYGPQIDTIRQQLTDPNFMGQAARAYIFTQMANGVLKGDQAKALLAKLPQELINLKNTGDLKHFQSLFYETKAADLSAVDQSIIDRNNAAATASYAHADQAEAAAAKDRVTTQQLLTSGGDPKLLGTVLSTFKGNVDSEQTALDGLVKYRGTVTVALQAAKSGSNPDLAKELNAQLADVDQRISKTQNQLRADRDLYGRAAHKAADVTGLTPGATPSLPSMSSIKNPSKGMKASSPDHPGIIYEYKDGPQGLGWYKVGGS